ncbi:NRDE family protein [Legionella jordanis]|uniref:NRDE family protein n=1 Tax=Legionella jordanis TaxID=456 RepID=UPI000EFF3415|nr:NRDE family protein [Legionella jordanis]RMX15752.1 NRDE family protein [Legionella jordanis]HAT8714350.1 hypothetical protein [Legionella jordanis]
MCLALIAIEQHPLFPLIILSNRDEFYHRASSAADFWSEDPDVFSGRDLLQNGTWLGVNRQAHFGLVTNFRMPGEQQSSKRSRGWLVKDFLLSKTDSPRQFFEQLKPVAKQYNRFNLIAGNLNEIYYYNNFNQQLLKLTPGVYGLSNHFLNSNWFKVNRAKELYETINPLLLKQTEAEGLISLLFSILSDRMQAPNDQLNNPGNHELEIGLSSIFLDLPTFAYGTNASSILLFSPEEIVFAEKTFSSGQLKTQKTQKLSIIKQSDSTSA